MPANNNDLEKRLWDAADELRANSRLRAAEYCARMLRQALGREKWNSALKMESN